MRRVNDFKKHIPLRNYPKHFDSRLVKYSEVFFEKMDKRRTVRTFSSEEIPIAAEKEEYKFYSERATKEWLNNLEVLDTNDQKPFLEKAPYLIVIFEEKYRLTSTNEKIKITIQRNLLVLQH